MLTQDELRVNKALKDIDKLLDKIIRELQSTNPDVDDILELFDPVAIRNSLNEAEVYDSLAGLVKIIEEKGEDIIRILKLDDVTESHNKEMIKETAKRGPAPRKRDKNGINKELMLIEVARFMRLRGLGENG